MITGCDIASYQGPPGAWVSVAGDIGFAAVKLTELSTAGPYVDPDAGADWAWLGEHGKLRMAYFYAHPAAPVADTVALFEGALSALGYTDDDMVSIDLETTDGRTAADVAAWTADVLGLLQRDLDRVPVVYTYIGFAEAGNCAGLDRWPLWIADPSSPAGHPRVPAPWTSFVMHQFDITGDIDRDVAAWPSAAEMAAALGRPKSPVPVTPVPALIAEDPMLLNKGAGAVTPIAIPDTAKSLRFLAADSAELEVEFHGSAAARRSITWAAGSHSLTPPKDVHAALVTRVDAGTGDVSVAIQ